MNAKTYWAWDGDNLHRLGDFESFEDADSAVAKSPAIPTVWIFNRTALTEFVTTAQKELIS